MHVDYIIIGQGIAGSMVAHFLLERGKKILVIDKHDPNSSSNIAAGVVNPVTGRRMAKSWMIDELLPFAMDTYRSLESKLNVSFYFERDIYKLFSSEDDIRTWKKKMHDPEYDSYLGEIIDEVDDHILSPMGTGIIKRGSWMNVPVFIRAFREFLKTNHLLLDEELDANALELSSQVRYRDVTASAIIYCEGFRAHTNPLFSFIPFSIAKGEQFLLHVPLLETEKLINRNIFIIPKKDHYYLAGSTFLWDDLETSVTEHGRKEVEDKLKKIISCEYTIVEEKAGIRPTIIDRRPVIGKHPKHDNVYLFNGMGTKGVSLSPYLAAHFVSYLHGESPLLDEVSLRRFER